MKKMNLTKIISSLLIVVSLFTLNPIGANATWIQNNTGWWYTEGNSWSIGWKEIDGTWYYFNSDGYMAHDTIVDGYKLGSDGAWVITQNAASTTTSQEKIVDVTVKTAQEFVNAIGSNKRILLEPGVYNLSSIEKIYKPDIMKIPNSSVVWIPVQDGNELNLQSIHNLTIEGIDSGKVEIKVDPRYANIMNFTDAHNITIKNIIAGHTPAPYECNAGVFEFNNSSDISIIDSELYGCGSMGVNLKNVKRLEVSNCKIDHCSLLAAQIYNSEDIKFTGSKIVDHEAYMNIIDINYSKNIIFEKCEIANNNNFDSSFIEAIGNSDVLLDKCIIKNNSRSVNSAFNTDKVYFFNTIDYYGVSDSKITIKDSEISYNKCDYLLNNKDSVTFENCTMNNNVWE